MKLRSVFGVLAALALLPALAAQGEAQSKKQRDEASQADKSATVFRQIMNTQDKAIPRTVLNGAECVAVFPQVIKAGFIVGGRGGRGVASCRVGRGWSAPIFLNLGGGSVGLQIGAQATDFVLLFMTKDGIDSLLSSKITLGADASVAAGPVGREAGASTDLKLNAQILSYSRSKGLFAGLELKGVWIEVDKDDVEDVYGRGKSGSEALGMAASRAPADVRVYPNTLRRYSARRAER